MNYKFSFQRILDFKEKEKDQVQQVYSELKQRELSLQDQLDDLEKGKAAAFHRYNHVDSKSIAEILEVNEEIKYINERIEQLNFQKRRIDHEMTNKQQQLIEKSQEVKMWNGWKEKSKAAFIEQMAQKEQAALDEMAILRYSRKI